MDNFHFMRVWWSQKDQFLIIGQFGFAKSQHVELQIVVCVCLDCHTDWSCWLN